MTRRPPRSTLSSSSAASDVYKRQFQHGAQVVVLCFLHGHRFGHFLRPVGADAFRLRLDAEHGYTGGVHVAGFQRHCTGHIAAGLGRLFIHVDAAEGAIRQEFSDEFQRQLQAGGNVLDCLLYTSDAADEEDSVDLGGRRIIKKKK